jgi:hypothetical protein
VRRDGDEISAASGRAPSGASRTSPLDTSCSPAIRDSFKVGLWWPWGEPLAAGTGLSALPASEAGIQAASFAAARITFIVAPVLETIGTCEAFTSDTVALARSAMKR